MGNDLRLALPAFVFALAACGASPTPPAATYTTEQLNAAAGPSLNDDSLGATGAASTSAPMPDTGVVDEPPPPAPAGLRVIHASPDRAAATASVFLDDAQVAAVQALRYKSVAGYLQLPAGEHAVVVRAVGAPATASPALSTRTPGLDAGRGYTAVVHGLTGAAPRLALAASADETTQPEAGKARVRFFHALVGLGAVDICRPGAAATPARPAANGQPAQPARPAQPAEALFANVAYGAFAAYADVTAGHPVTLQIRAQNARPCTGLVRGTVTVNPADRAVLTAVAVGRVAGAPPVARELLLCADGAVDGAPTCNAVAIR